MKVIFTAAEIEAFKITVIAVARDARSIPGVPGEKVFELVRQVREFDAAAVAAIQEAFDPAHVRLTMDTDGAVTLETSLDLLKAQLAVAEEYYGLAFDLAAMAAPVLRLLKKFAGRVEAKALALAEMVMAKPAAQTSADE